MAIYSIWNNKGGVGKSYLTFQIASEYAIQNPDKKVLVIDLCPQANSSSMLLGGMVNGERVLNAIHSVMPRNTISGYVEDRILSPYVNLEANEARVSMRIIDSNDNLRRNELINKINKDINEIILIKLEIIT